jgi:Rrf2 family protein
MPAANVQFSIATHAMTVLAQFQGEHLTSAAIAKSVNTTPSFVRRVLSRLAKAQLVKTIRGPAGCCAIAKSPDKISLYDIYAAVESPKVFSIHSYAPDKTCLVSCNFKSAFEHVLDDAQGVMERSLKSCRLSDLVSNLKKKPKHPRLF